MSRQHEAYTPGPWSVEVEAEQADCQSDIYVCHPATECDVTVVCTMGTTAAVSPHQKIADARLIAAAPELHYVATLVTELADVLGEKNAVVLLARAALAKAATVAQERGL